MNKKLIFALLAAAALAVVLLLPSPPGIVHEGQTIALSRQGKAALAVLAMAVILWMTEALPFPIAGLLAMVALVMTKAAPLRTLMQDGFGHPIVLFFLGVLIFSVAIGRTNLLKRLTLVMLFRLGHRPAAILLVILTAGALLSGWITDMAVAAVLLPIGVSILKDAGVRPRESNFGRALMISCAWGPLIGGISTPAGCGPNPLTMGFLRDLAGIEFSFVDWMAIGFPAMILMLPCAWLILLKVFPPEKLDLKITEDDFRRRLAEIGRPDRKEVATLVMFAVTIFLWIAADWIEQWTGGAVDYLDISFVAVACSCVLFLPGVSVMTWKEVQTSIDWGGILLIVSGLSLGMTVHKTGAAGWLAWVAFNRIAVLGPVLIVFAVVLGVSLMKVMFSSNTVTGIIIVPILIALARTLGLDPTLVAIPAGITASLAFILVTSTPTNVSPYSSGYFSIADMAKAGLWMTLASSACVTASVCIVGRLLGIVRW